MKKEYNADRIGVFSTLDGGLVVRHDHAPNIDYNSYSNRELLAQKINTELPKLKTCQAFFKIAMTSPCASKSQCAAAAVEEDEALIRQHTQHIPISCGIL